MGSWERWTGRQTGRGFVLGGEEMMEDKVMGGIGSRVFGVGERRTHATFTRGLISVNEETELSTRFLPN